MIVYHLVSGPGNGGEKKALGARRSGAGFETGRREAVTVAVASTSSRIVDAALAAFGTRGYEATSLDSLAATLGVRKQTILYHFPSKEALLDAVIDEAGAELIARARAGHLGLR